MSFCPGREAAVPTLPKPAGAGPRGRGRSRRRAGQSLGWGRARTRPRSRSRAQQAPGGRLRGSGPALRASVREEPREGERRTAEEGGGWRVCGRERVRARARVRAPSPRPSPPRAAPFLLPPPRAPAQPPESVQLLPCRLRIPPVPPSAASPLGASAQPAQPAQQRPPVPSCEPRPQPRTAPAAAAPRSRLPAHPPGRRGAGGGRDPGTPTPLSLGGR